MQCVYVKLNEKFPIQHEPKSGLINSENIFRPSAKIQWKATSLNLRGNVLTSDLMVFSSLNDTLNAFIEILFRTIIRMIPFSTSVIDMVNR